MSHNKKVIILGAGVGGLTCAHELIKYGFEVEVFERNSEVGGQARSKYVFDPKTGGQIHSEYCWHVVGNGYHYLIDVLKEIPTNQSGKTVFDNLKPITEFIYGRVDTDLILEEKYTPFLASNSLTKFQYAIRSMGKRLTSYDLWFLSKIYLVANCHNLKNLERYDHILWKDYTKNISPELKKWIAESPAIYLGMDIDRLSSHLMLKLLRTNRNIKNLKYDYYSFNGPINQQWFDIWKKYLESLGVKFHLNTTVVKINTKNNRIKNCVTEKGLHHGAKFFVNALSMEQLAHLIPSHDYQVLTQRSIQLQTQVLYFLNSRLKLDGPAILIFPDTEWCLMVRVESMLWDVEMGDCQDILSCGIGIVSRPGMIYKKTMRDCTRDEIMIECWCQLLKSKQLFQYIKTEDGKPLAKVEIINANIWDSFQFENNQLKTWEPKFSNNVDCLHLRPKIYDQQFDNLRHATAYSKTETNTFNMESAAEAGKKAADSILRTKNINIKLCKKRDRPNWFFKGIQYLNGFV